MKKGTYLNLVGINCPPELDEKFNKWYDEVHIPMLMKFKGVKSVTRTRITKPVGNLPQYLAIWEFDNRADFVAWLKSPDLAAAFKDSGETFKDQDFERVFRVQYEVTKVWER